jgi:hypothetical protein
MDRSGMDSGRMRSTTIHGLWAGGFRPGFLDKPPVVVGGKSSIDASPTNSRQELFPKFGGLKGTMKSAISAVSAALVAVLLGAPCAAGAAAAERSYQLQTRIVEKTPGVGEFDGSLQLRVSPAGIVSGYYRPDDNPRFVPVTGGISGDRFWIEIGTFAAHPLQFSGTFSGGKIDAASNQPIVDNGRYTALELIGTPKPA